MCACTAILHPAQYTGAWSVYGELHARITYVHMHIHIAKTCAAAISVPEMNKPMHPSRLLQPWMSHEDRCHIHTPNADTVVGLEFPAPEGEGRGEYVYATFLIMCAHIFISTYYVHMYYMYYVCSVEPVYIMWNHWVPPKVS